MESVWFSPELSLELKTNPELFKQTPNIVSDIISKRLDITLLVENMGGALTDKEVESREKGMRFFTKLLKELPVDYLLEPQVNFISKFYTDRLKDHHSIIPSVLDGYLAIIKMKCYKVDNCAEFLSLMFREVPCQSQVRQDRYGIYLIIKTLLQRNIEYMKTLGPDFVYGVISAIDGERDPRNLIFLFDFLPLFLSNIPLGHLIEEMFDVISCYYPIDFHPSPNDPDAVSRQELANALTPCLCGTPEFGELCLVLLIEKLDSSLRIAKLDSLRLLKESCSTFKPESYTPFLKTLWSSINREISHKTDEELKMAAHEALSALTTRISETANTDQAFENFVKGILITQQTAIAESTTVAQFTQSARVLLTTANSSKESCLIITKAMIPAILTYYGFNTAPRLQVASLSFLADLYDLAKHRHVAEEIKELNEIPQLCLTAASQPDKDYQVASFKTLTRVINVLGNDLLLPFIEILMHNIDHSLDIELFGISKETVYAIAQKFPEDVMNIVVMRKCNLKHLHEDQLVSHRLDLLTDLASLDSFTKDIMTVLLKIITEHKDADKVIKSLNESFSKAILYPSEKVIVINNEFGIVDCVIEWLLKEISNNSNKEAFTHGLELVSTVISYLPKESQINVIDKHTNTVIDKCKVDEIYVVVLECLYNALQQDIYKKDFSDILTLAVSISTNSSNNIARKSACVIVANFLNKTGNGSTFESTYNTCKSCLSDSLNLKLIELYSWITKALILKGSELYLVWLQKILQSLIDNELCFYGSAAIKLIMEEDQIFSFKRHCCISILYRQRLFQTFASESVVFNDLKNGPKEAYLLSWAYILAKLPKTLLKNEITKITPIVIESLDYNNKDLLLVVIDILSHIVQTNRATISTSLQTILPRLVKLSTYTLSMDVRMKSLHCLYEIANNFPTVLLLPYKQDILLELAPSLDDKKRLVRNIAVKARTRWFLIGSPGESKEE